MKKGFTLIELLAVIVIIAIISLIAIPQMSKLIANVRLKADLESVRGYVTAAENYYMKAQFNQSLYDTLGTNVIDKLSIKGDKLNGSVVITRDGKIELAIEKGSKCYRKSALDNNASIKVFDKSSCSNDNTKYVSNNGHLHVCGRYLCNSNNEVVRLKGMGNGLGAAADMDNPTRGEVNKNSLATLKSWGANTYRLFATASSEFTFNYVGNETKHIEAMKKIMDIIIDSDMYVIVNWDPEATKTNPQTDKAVEFFTKIAQLYPNDPHVLYEVWNEPEAANTWSDVKNHASRIIEEVRKISPDSVFVVGSPSHDRDVNLIINDTLPYKNVIYSYHMYAREYTRDHLNKLNQVLDANIPLIVTEFGGAVTHEGLENLFAESYSVSFYNLIQKYNLSFIGFAFGTSKDTQLKNIYGIVKRGNWRDDLPDSILKPIGIFMKGILSDSYKTSTYLMRENNSSVGETYRSSEWKDKIESIEFKNKINPPSNMVMSWDLSFASDESVMGYLVPTNTQDRYKLLIEANGLVNIYMNADYLFAGMTNLKSIDFTNASTRYIKTMNKMFENDESLVSTDLSNFDDSLLTEMTSTFSGCINLESINLKGFNPKLTKLSMLFYKCQNLKTLDLNGFDVTNVKNFSGLFNSMSSLESVDISSWTPTVVTSLSNAFRNNPKLSFVDMSNMVIPTSADIDSAFKLTKAGARVIVKDQATIDLLEPTATNALNFEIKK